MDEFRSANAILIDANEDCATVAKAGEAVQRLCADELRAFAVLGDAGPQAAALVNDLSGLEQKLEVMVGQAKLEDTQLDHNHLHLLRLAQQDGQVRRQAARLLR